MKKINIGLCVLMAALIFIGASVWEGSAAVSTSGEFPEGAYYAATNSFPRNTVVDVTNLENGRTIRVIVAASLDSPGLLAMLSRNAATAIGIQTRGIGRIRMTQPSDPVAYSRFTDDRELSGNPEDQVNIAPNTPAVVSSTVRTARTGDLASANPEDRFYSDVVNRPETYNPPPVSYPADGSVRVEARPNWLPEEVEPAPVIAEVVYPEVPPATDPEPTLIAVPTPEPASPPLVLVAPASKPTALPPPPPPPVITLVPAEERPPQSAVTIAPRTEIPPVGSQPSKDDTYLDPRFFIGPIPPHERPAPRSAPQATIASAPRTASVVPQQPSLPKGSIFSVPITNQLEGGKYYVQIGAFTQPDTLEVAVTRINRRYPLTVQPGGSHNSLVYRLLIGPLNVGESGAVLQRVKSNGYPDAFVRYQ
ncbi:SPOR domain-containing protein [Treponema primitia]|uniref:SPOR domain-containing protein n=1 Tax=Treponema primitia TaxID=88058 RepID=UPI0002555608|nr:SPOR domain-containing protein [Treponema primitia]